MKAFLRTALNDAVDVLYALCAGAHEPSDTYVWRDFYSVTLYIPVCRNCGVPIRGLTKVQAFNRVAA